MSKSKRKSVLLVIGILLALLIIPSSVLAQLKNSKTGHWQVSISYPRFKSKGPVANMANSASMRAERNDYREFLKLIKGAGMSSGVVASDRFSLIVTPTVTVDSPTICSGYVERYEYTGGANANTTYNVINYAKFNDSVEKIYLQDLFHSATDAVKESSNAIKELLELMQATPSAISSGTWKTLTDEQAQRFAIEKYGLLFLFNKYELGSGAEGDRKVLVPYSALNGLDKEGILKPIIEELEKSSLFKLASGKWVLESIQYNDDTTINAEPNDENNWIEFKYGNVIGRAGINRFRGSYKATEDGTL
ncbi:MAG: DUF3298 domain-containing protein, partial [Armatimonadota bacterium]